MEQQSGIEYEQFSKPELIEMLKLEKETNKTLSEMIKTVNARAAKITTEIEVEEDYIANKLMKRMNELQKEKDKLMRKVQAEEENIQNNIKSKLRKLYKEKIDLENQLEREQEYITHKLSKQLKDAISKKDALQKKLEAESRAKEELKRKIEEEDMLLKKSLEAKLEKLRKEKLELEAQKEQEIENTIKNMSKILERLVSERNELEEQLAKEVQEKQDLVMALSKEKHNLTKELQSKIREVRKEKQRIRKQIAAQQELFSEETISKDRNLSETESNTSEGGPSKRPMPAVAAFLGPIDKTSRNDRVFACVSEEVKGDKPVAKGIRCQMRSPSVVVPATEKVERMVPKSPLLISKVFAQHEKRLLLLQRDRDIYDAQNQKMMRQIMTLTTQLEDAKSEALKCSIIRINSRGR